MATATNPITTTSASQIVEVMRTNRILGVQALVFCRDEGISRSLARTLLDLGIASRFFEKAEAALEAMNLDRFDLVVVDCDDVKGGMALLQLARRTPSNKTATILALVNQQTPMQAAFQVGATLALQKPFSASLLGLILRASQGNVLRERRRTFRQPVEIPVTLSTDRGPDLRATAINLSEDGMALQTHSSLPADCPVRVRFDLPGTRVSVEAEGTIAWTDRTGRMGLRFLNMQQFVRRVLEKWLQTQFEQLLAEQKKETESLLPSRAMATVNRPQPTRV
jgi:CheY-like chemotaxis protein